MNESFLLDTNIISELVAAKGARYEKVCVWLAATRKPLAISVVTVYEVESGLLHKNYVNRMRAFKDIVESLKIKVIELNEAAAQIAAHRRANGMKQGIQYSSEDLFIGATAIHNAYTLATANTKDFQSWVPDIMNPLS